MSDLILNVRQIGNYPQVLTSTGQEKLLVQQSGLGGPYASMDTGTLVQTAAGSLSIGVGTQVPADAIPGHVFTNTNHVLPLDASLLWNAYFGGLGEIVSWRGGQSAAITFGPGGYSFEASTNANPDQPPAFVDLMNLDPAGHLTLPFSTLTVARDPATYFDVATMGWVGKSTVASFNQRNGAVTLNARDVYSALKLCDPIATQPWVNQAIQNSIQNLLYTCPFVNTWNGRQGQVYLMLSDITCVFFQSGQQPISPTPAQGSSDNSIATTGWVTDYIAGGIAPLTGLVVNGTTQDPNATTDTALFVGTGASANQQWFPATSVAVPNGGLFVAAPQPYGAGGLACAAYIQTGQQVSAIPQVQGGVTETPADLALYPGRDQVALLTATADQGPLLVLENVSFDATHLYLSAPLTAAQIASVKVNMVIDTTHTPKFSGLITGVAPDGSSITVEGWYQTAGMYTASVAVAAGGAGYQVGDVCPVIGPVPSSNCPIVGVTSVSGGAITGVSVIYGGSYFPLPQIDVRIAYPLYGGSGSGGTVYLTTASVVANTATGQNPQNVPLFGTAPGQFKAFVNPVYKTWNRNSIAQVGGGYGTNPWTPPYVQGGGVCAASGEEMDVSNNTGIYVPGHAGMDGDYPQIRGFEITNQGNARVSIGIMIAGDFQNGFVTYGQYAGTTAFGCYQDTYGFTFQVDPMGPLHLGGQATALPDTSPVVWHTTGSPQIDAELQAQGGIAGTPYAASLSAVATNLLITPSASGNSLVMAGASTGGSPGVSVQGPDANIGLQFFNKGSGVFDFNNTVTVTHSGGGTGSSFVAQATDNPSFALYAEAGGVDMKTWDFTTASNTLAFRTVNDGQSAVNNWLTVTRVGNAPQAITLIAPQIVLADLAASPSYANDAAAAAGGVIIDQLYRNGSAVMVRVT